MLNVLVVGSIKGAIEIKVALEVELLELTENLKFSIFEFIAL